MSNRNDDRWRLETEDEVNVDLHEGGTVYLDHECSKQPGQAVLVLVGPSVVAQIGGLTPEDLRRIAWGCAEMAGTIERRIAESN